MAVLNSIADRQEYFAKLRQQIHMNPELGFDTVETAALVVEELKRMGVDDIHTGVAQNGVVAVIKGRAEGRTIGLRADMDALPILEATGLEYSSRVDGKMHACGHDGHTAILLAAAEHLAENRDFDGNVVLIFQPAEEGGGGAGVMVREGVLDRFGIEEIYAFHNLPGSPLGRFDFSKGPTMASTDTFDITVIGRGGHAAYPEQTIDPIPVALAMVDAIYNIKSRKLAASDPVVVSVTQIHSGTAENIVPDDVRIQGTIRTLSPEARDLS